MLHKKGPVNQSSDRKTINLVHKSKLTCTGVSNKQWQPQISWETTSLDNPRC